MRMIIESIEYRNIRKFDDLLISFIDNNGNIIKNSFIMMGNGTGKTTTMTLIKGLLDGSAINWDPDEVKSYNARNVNEGEFSISVKYDNKSYKYILVLDYISGKATIETLASEIGGRETGRFFPESLKNVFTKDFVSRFVFDGEQALKAMDSSSSEAEEMIRNLYKLDELDEILALNEKNLRDYQDSLGKKGTEQSVKVYRTKLRKSQNTIEELEYKLNNLKKENEKLIKQFDDKKSQKDDIDRKSSVLNIEKNDIQSKLLQNSEKIEGKIKDIMSIIKKPDMVLSEFNDRMVSLGTSMTKLKLPKSSSKDFFIELSKEKFCICGHCIGELERKNILQNSEKYLGTDQQSILNLIKSNLVGCEYNNKLERFFKELKELRESEAKLNARNKTVEDKLLKAGGAVANELKKDILNLQDKISQNDFQIKIIESKDENDETLNDENNLYKAELSRKKYQSEIATATQTYKMLQKKEKIEYIINEIKLKATEKLKQEIILKTNEKLKHVITDDNIQIESIDKYIKLKGKNAASEGQTLSIAYCFLGTLFEDSELEFPFIIDSPTGKMDFIKREKVAAIIPKVFKQMISFVQSAEIERFADRFYDSKDAQFITIIANIDNGVEIHNGVDYFDNYQKNNPEEAE